MKACLEATVAKVIRAKDAAASELLDRFTEVCVRDSTTVSLPTSSRRSIAVAAALIRLRWQIELLFKQWKSAGLLGESRSQRPDRILCELFAKMLALVLQHWILVRTCWRYANRSLIRASKAIRSLAGLLATAWRDRAAIAACIGFIADALQKTGRVDRRKKHPSTFQVIKNPNDCGYKIFA